MASREVQVRLRTLDGYLTPAAREAILRRAAELAIGRIKRRTGKGVDVDGKAFKPYSTGYAKQKSASGRNASPPTLLLSGAMLASMDILQADPTRVVIGFKGSSAAVKFAKRSRPTKDRKTGAKVTRSVAETNRTISNALKARWNDKGEGHAPRRHFFGLSREDRIFLVKDALKQVIETVRTASFGRLSSAGALRRARLAGRPGQ